jgi:hypothetical protein
MGGSALVAKRNGWIEVVLCVDSRAHPVLRTGEGVWLVVGLIGV